MLQFKVRYILKTGPLFNVLYFWFLSVILLENSLIFRLAFGRVISTRRKSSSRMTIVIISLKHSLLQYLFQFGITLIFVT